MIIPAASTSLIGAIVFATLYPRLCNDCPELSKDSVQILRSI